jgi:hypothetical protein
MTLQVLRVNAKTFNCARCGKERSMTARHFKRNKHGVYYCSRVCASIAKRRQIAPDIPMPKNPKERYRAQKETQARLAAEDVKRTCRDCKTAKLISDFKVGSNQCKACRALWRKNYYDKNPTKEYEATLRWRAANIERVREYRRKWSKLHPKTRAQKDQKNINKFKNQYGKHWKHYRELLLLSRELSRDPVLCEVDAEKRRQKQRRENGYHKRYNKKRSKNPAYNEKRNAQRRNATRIRRAKRGGDQTGNPPSNIKTEIKKNHSTRRKITGERIHDYASDS